MTIDTVLENNKTNGNVSSVYGPVYSWRVGWSLGIDLLLETSTCSFNCVYCQLGEIQLKTSERKIYVPTDKIERDLRLSDWEKADIITLSGSGEPTLALNLKEVIHLIKEYTQKPVMVLTNATLLNNDGVIADLQEADIVACKLDGTSEELMQRMNRPVAGITLDSIMQGILKLRQSGFKGKLCLQCMFMPTNLSEIETDILGWAKLINQIQPDEVQLNTPKRPYPLSWNVVSRGNHVDTVPYKTATLRVITPEEAQTIERILKENTSVKLISVYQE